MPKKTPQQKAIEFSNWKRTVNNMMDISKNPTYKYTNPKNKYYLFTEHMKGWMEGLFGNAPGEEEGYFTSIEPKDLDEEQKEWTLLTKDNLTPMHTDWWQVALGTNKQPGNPLPTLDSTLNPDDAQNMKDEVYDKFLPVYRALKENFEKRWWFEFIFNHRQYTAERDTLKVMGKMMLSMTGDSIEDFDEKYRQFTVEVPSGNINEAIRRQNEIAEVKKNLEKSASEGSNDKKYEQLMEDIAKNKEEQARNDLDEAMKKASNEFTTYDQFIICTQDETFNNKLTEDFKALFAGKTNPALLKLMGKSHLYNPLTEAVKTFCSDYDDAVANESQTAVKEVVNEGVKKIFKIALQATKNLTIKDLQQRIIIAQKLTDVALNSMSPIAFKQSELSAYGKGFMVLRNSEEIYKAMDGELDYPTFENIISDAKATFAEMYPENAMNDIEPVHVDLNEVNVDIVPPVDNKVNEINPLNKSK